MLRSGLKMVSHPPGGGYGDAGCQYLAGLDAVGVPVTWTPVSGNLPQPLTLRQASAFAAQDLRPQLHRALYRPLDYDALLLHVPPPARHADWLRSEPGVRHFTYTRHGSSINSPTPGSMS